MPLTMKPGVSVRPFTPSSVEYKSVWRIFGAGMMSLYTAGLRDVLGAAGSLIVGICSVVWVMWSVWAALGCGVVLVATLSLLFYARLRAYVQASLATDLADIPKHYQTEPAASEFWVAEMDDKAHDTVTVTVTVLNICCGEHSLFTNRSWGALLSTSLGVRRRMKGVER
jgi:hypothetical protein